MSKKQLNPQLGAIGETDKSAYYDHRHFSSITRDRWFCLTFRSFASGKAKAMVLDPSTLLFASAAGRCTYVLIFLVKGLRHRNEQYFLHWAASISLSVLGLLLTSGGVTYPFLNPLHGANTYAVFGCSIVFCWSGMRLFQGRTFAWWSFCAQSLLPGALYGCVDMLTGRPPTALACMFAGLSVITARTTGELLLAARRERLFSQFLAGGALAAYLLMFITSMVLFAMDYGSVMHPEKAYFSLEIDQFCSILIYIGFLAMAGERAQTQIERLATTDPLTGIANRRGVLALVQRTIPLLLRYSKPVSVLLADIDHFKEINDRLGHDAGDAVLTEFAGRCQGVLKRRGDMVARWGGEEFLAVLHDVNLDQAVDMGERVRAAVAAKPFFFETTSFAVTVSIGAACMEGGEAMIEPVIRRADRALYKAKEGGRNRVCA